METVWTETHFDRFFTDPDLQILFGDKCKTPLAAAASASAAAAAAAAAAAEAREGKQSRRVTHSLQTRNSFAYMYVHTSTGKRRNQRKTTERGRYVKRTNAEAKQEKQTRPHKQADRAK